MNKNNKGFTLLELLAVLIIMSALSSIVLPIIANKKQEADIVSHNMNVRILKERANAYILEYDVMDKDNIIDDMVEKGFLKKKPEYKFGKEEYIVKVKDKVIYVTPNILNEDDLKFVITYEDFSNDTYKGAGTTANWNNGTLKDKLTVENVYGGSEYDEYSGVVKLNDKYYCVGFSESNLGSFQGGQANKGKYDMVIAKHNEDLSLEKMVSIGGGENDKFNHICVDSGNTVVAVGSTTSDLSSYPGGKNSNFHFRFLISKFDDDLNLIKLNNVASGSHSSVIKDNNYYIAVGSSSANFSSYDKGVNTNYKYAGVICKYDNDLNMININNEVHGEYGAYNDLIQDSEGNYVVVGRIKGDLSSLPGAGGTLGEYDCIIAKYDSNLNLIKIHNLSSDKYDGSMKIIQDEDGNYLCQACSWGDFSSIGGPKNSDGVKKTIIIKYDKSLNLLGIEDYDSNKYPPYIFNKSKKVVSSTSNNDFCIYKYIDPGMYHNDLNILESKLYDLGETVSKVKIEVDATLEDGTSYEFYISKNGVDYSEVSVNKLNGKKYINIGDTDKISYKIKLLGEEDKTPIIKKVTICK